MNLREAPTEALLSFTGTLSTRDWRKFTERDIAAIDVFIASDGNHFSISYNGVQ